MGERCIEIDRRGGVAELWLSRPEARNALNSAMCRELLQALDQLAGDEEAAVVLLRARGPVFSAGADLRERQGMDAAQVRQRRELAFDLYDRLESFPKPLLAVVHGALIGAGAEMATACDFAIATPAASVRYPEVGWGTVGATQRLPEIVGKRLAKELLFSGRTVPADEACRLGIFNRVVEAGDLERALAELVDPMLRAPREALVLVKRSVNTRFDEARTRARAEEMQAIEELLAGANWRSRMNEFGNDRNTKET
jgi:enoyl-CoA hydratase